MDKIYAVVCPSSYNTPGLAALGGMFVDLYHRVRYESVHGYSLGSNVHFFDSLDDAKEFLFPKEATGIWWRRYSAQDAVLELEVEDSEVKNIKAIYESGGFNQRQVINSGDVSPAALEALSEKLKERYVSPHRIDAKSTHPKAQLCRQLSTQFKQVNIAPEEPKGLSITEFLKLLGGEAAILLGVVGLMSPEARSAAVVLCALGAYSTKSAFNRVNDYYNFQDNKKAFIRHTLFASSPAATAPTPASPELSPSLSH